MIKALNCHSINLIALTNKEFASNFGNFSSKRMSRLITVFGATGAQGGDVVKALLAGGKFKVRGITRSVESKKAKELASKGVEMVQANFDEPKSLHKAIAGSYGVFLVTNFWDGLDGARETKQGKGAVDVCLQESVKHLVYGGLESAEKMYGFVVGTQFAFYYPFWY